jgi:dsRNA-specific ribonuclease
LPSFSRTNNLPVFVFQKDEVTGLFFAQVTLPNSIHPSLRRVSALRGWSTEYRARKDAAFQAYVALYNAGLLNANLLPLLSEDMLPGIEGMDDKSSIVMIQQQYNPWYDVAKKWSISEKRYWKTVNIRCAKKEVTSVYLILPLDVPSLQWTPLSSLEGIGYECSMRVSEAAIDTEICDVHLLRTVTKMILRFVRGRCATGYSDDFVTLFAPQRAAQEIRDWLESHLTQNSSTNKGSKDRPHGLKLAHNDKLPRNRSLTRRCHPEDDIKRIATTSELLLINRMKSMDISEADEKTQVNRLKDHSTVYSTSEFWIPDEEPTNMTQLYHDAEKFALLAPFVVHRLEILLVGKELLDRLLPNVHFRNWQLLVEAISTSSARELSSNKRLAFLGDTVLEFIVTSQLFVNHSIWHPGYLSAKKKLIISNSHLSRMALDVGLDKFILTDQFDPNTWKPHYISDVLNNDVESTRPISKGMLADAVEALIGAAYLDGQYENSFECTRIFLPEIGAHSIGSSFCPTVLDCDRGNSAHFAPTHFALLEELIGYKFRNSTILAEAMTHPSYEQDLAIGSYERLAFLGSAVLSMVIVESLYRDKQPLSSNQMHLLRTATINNGFLAFICLETCMEKKYIDIQQSSPSIFTQVRRGRSIALWGFLRYGRPELAEERSNYLEKHAETCQRIRQGLISDMNYPWQELAKLELNSDLSDIIQALFGAVFYDSSGDMHKCVLLAEKLRILPILRQLMQRKVDILHPKTRLQELAREQEVTYLTEVDSLTDTYDCVIQMNGKVIAKARDGSCREEIVIRAAELAIMSLERTNGEQ